MRQRYETEQSDTYCRQGVLESRDATLQTSDATGHRSAPWIDCLIRPVSDSMLPVNCCTPTAQGPNRQLPAENCRYLILPAVVKGPDAFGSRLFVPSKV